MGIIRLSTNDNRDSDVEYGESHFNYFEDNHQGRHTTTLEQQEQEQFDCVYSDASKYYSLEELVDRNLYTLKQKHGIFSILFSFVQTMILLVMMIMCEIAPMNINRKLFLDHFQNIIISLLTRKSRN